MRGRSASIAVLAVFLLGACGVIGGAEPTPTPSVRERALVAWTQAIQCARDHGWNVPDPSIDDLGNATFPNDVGKPPEDVLAACAHFIEALPAPRPEGSGPTPEDIRLSRQLAACLRDNGMPTWPDPNADGTFPLTPEISAEGKSERFLAAARACARLSPSGRFYFGQPR